MNFCNKYCFLKYFKKINQIIYIISIYITSLNNKMKKKTKLKKEDSKVI